MDLELWYTLVYFGPFVSPPERTTKSTQRGRNNRTRKIGGIGKGKEKKNKTQNPKDEEESAKIALQHSSTC